MASLARRLAVALLLGGFAVLVSATGATADDKKKDDKKAEKVPDLHDIMEKNKGKNALHTKIAEAAKAEKWDDAQKLAKEFKELGAAVPKNTPHKGSDDSWKKFSKKYAEDTAAVAEAADKKDAKTVGTTTAAFGKTCAGCHKEHK